MLAVHVNFESSHVILICVLSAKDNKSLLPLIAPDTRTDGPLMIPKLMHHLLVLGFEVNMAHWPTPGVQFAPPKYV